MSATYTVTITPKPATGNGDIDGFSITCTCGNVAGLSLKTMATQYAADHEAWHARKDAAQKRAPRAARKAQPVDAKAAESKALATKLRKEIRVHRRATVLPVSVWRSIGERVHPNGNDALGWPASVYAAVHGTAYAINTGRVSGSTAQAIRELSDWDKCALVADIALACRVIGDVPRYLNQRFAA